MTELIWFVVATLVVGAVGVVVGMLVAPRLTRISGPDRSERDDEDPGDRHDSEPDD